MNQSNCKAYEQIKKQEIKELQSTGYLLRHKKTKAHIVLLENDDENKVFNIGFRTPPKDSTGVAHIVEHTVLCGSKEFPLKDPFIELAKGSLNTFLNAMTYPDKTVYPIASCNDKDFQNLMHVYLDAVFYPNIYKEEKIFRQEGWHYELDSEDGQLTYNGVVYNEMKGVFSSPSQILEREIQQSLFPDTPYGVESGGDPAVIPELSYEDYLKFHSTYYHPSNSYIYLYGDMDMEEKLNWIDEHYLSAFDEISVDSEVTLQQPFPKMRDVSGYYSVAEGEETEDKAYISYNAVCGDGLESMEYMAFQVLTHVLVKSVGAPLKEALVDAGIGNDIDCYYEESIRQPYFSIQAHNVSIDKKQAFLDVVDDQLRKIVAEGLNKDSLLAAINGLEFQCREADYGNFPKGLMYGLQIYDSWLYDDDEPFMYLHVDDIFAYLKEHVDTGYFEGLIERYLLDNPHASCVCVEPKVGLTGQMDQAERDKLAIYKASLSDAQIKDLVRETADLRAYQEEPDSPEALACIPVLAREDLKKEAQPYANEERQMGQIPAVYHDIYTNGIGYFILSFDVTDLKEYTPYMSLLTELISTVDTEHYDKLSLSNEILMHAGGLSTNLTMYTNRSTGEYNMYFEVSSKALYDQMEYVFDVIGEILRTSKIDDEKRLYEVLGESVSSKQLTLQAAGHNTAITRALAYQSDSNLHLEYINGIAYYDFLNDMLKHFDERKEDLISTLKALMKKMFVRQRMEISVTADAKGYDSVADHISRLTDALPDDSDVTIQAPGYPVKPFTANEGFLTAGKVQYVARVGNFKKRGIPYHGITKVIKTILSYDYLWNQVRVKGGAYGVMCGFSDTGNGYFVSYRDPHLAQTNQVFEGVPKYLREFSANERDMMKYIIGTLSDLDTPLTPRAKGRRSYVSYRTGVTYEDTQRERDQVLQADEESVHKAADMMAAILDDGYICAIGGEEKIKEEGTLFNDTRVLL